MKIEENDGLTISKPIEVEVWVEAEFWVEAEARREVLRLEVAANENWSWPWQQDEQNYA